MLQSQHHSPDHLSYNHPLRRNPLLQRHPVLAPLVLLCTSLSLGTASYFTIDLFPLLTLFGISSIAFCFCFALALGIAGILAGIIGIIERLDHYSIQPAMYPQAKEQSYVNRN